jgi:hypothetical protein
MDIREIQPSEIEAARRLLEASGWLHRVSNPDEFRQLVSRSQQALVAVQDGAKSLAFLRALTDGMANGYISMLVVAEQPSQRHRRALVRAVRVRPPHDVGSSCRTGRVGGFYEKIGFVRSEVAMERPGERTSDA